LAPGPGDSQDPGAAVPSPPASPAERFCPMYHETSPAATPAPDETPREPAPTAEELAELDRLDAEDRAKRAEDRAANREWARAMGAHIVEDLAALDSPTLRAVQQYLTGLHMIAVWVDGAWRDEALDAREAASAASRQAAREGGPPAA
jgi:hypothetical protein